MKKLCQNITQKLSSEMPLFIVLIELVRKKATVVLFGKI